MSIIDFIEILTFLKDGKLINVVLTLFKCKKCPDLKSKIKRRAQKSDYC
jgi:hypothetical protein